LYRQPERKQGILAAGPGKFVVSNGSGKVEPFIQPDADASI